MIDHFIDDLVKDLKPVSKLRNSVLALIGLIGFALVFAYVVLRLGVRADFNAVMNNGVLLWKNGGLLFAAIGSAYLLLKLARPQNAPKKIYVLPAIIIGLLVIWQIIAQSDFDLLKANFGGSGVCISTTIVGGIFILVPLWHFWISKTAPQNPLIIGAIAGVLSGAISAFAYSFHCNMDGAIYYLVCYWIPIMALGGIGAILGKTLKW